MGEQVGVENRKKSLGTSGGQVEKGKDKKEYWAENRGRKGKQNTRQRQES